MESAKNERDWITRVIKDSLVSLFPNQIDKNTKGNSLHYVISIVPTRRRP
jgi:hypothetical protein